ncbi:MAG: universal stress protein [Myxococcaceae bacterium]
MYFSPKHILLPVALEPEDDFDLALKAVDSACDLADSFQSEITLLSLTPPSYAQSTQYDVNSDVYRAFELLLKAKLSRAAELLAKLQKKVEDRHIKVVAEAVETEQTVAEAICQKAQQKNIDLIVIGSHARKGVQRLLLGSVASRVANLSPVPVLLLHR